MEGNEALLVAKALKNGAADKTSSKRLKQIIHILWEHDLYKGFTPERLVAAMQELGPTFVKIGQMMSSRTDIFPEAYCRAFATLRSNAEPMSFEEVEARLNEEYDGDYTKVFRRVNKRPLGSASVAQVHKAVLRHGGDLVAIKVQRPGVKARMTEDIELLRRANDLMEVTAAQMGEGGFDVSAFVDELERTVREEIDFRVEAANLRDFRANNEDEPEVSSPAVYDDLTSETILVMEYVEGPEIGEIDKLKAQGVDLHHLGDIITHNYIKQLLHDGLFHADPHPGNIIVVENGIEWIDLGMVGRLSENERGLLRKLFYAVASRDAQELKNILLVWGRATGEVDHGKLLLDLDAMIKRYASDSIVDIDLVAALGDLLTLIRGQHISMPPSFTMLARGIMTYEGTLEAIAPDLSIIGTINEYLRDTLLDNLDIEGEVQDTLFGLRKLAHKAVNIPSQLSDLLDMLAKGEMRVQVGVRDLEKPLQKLSSTIDRATLGMIVVGLFIGSSLLCTTTMEPRILGVPMIGFFGFLGALCLSIYIVFKGRP